MSARLRAAGLWALLWLICFILKRANHFDFLASKDRIEQITKVLGTCGYRPNPDPAAPAVMMKSVIASNRLPHHVTRRFASAPMPGRNFELMNFAYTIYSKSSGSAGHGLSHSIGQTIALITNEQWNFPQFAINPHGLWKFVAIQLGTGDIDFDSHPKFSRLFKVQCADEAALRALLRPAIMEMLEQYAGLSVEGLGNSLVLYYREKELKPAQYAEFQESTRKIAALFVN